EFAVGLVEAHDDALVERGLRARVHIARVARVLVVGADEYLAVGDDGPAVGLVAQRHGPLNVLFLALLDVPVNGHVLLEGVDQVALYGAAEHGPVAGGVGRRVGLRVSRGPVGQGGDGQDGSKDGGRGQ